MLFNLVFSPGGNDRIVGEGSKTELISEVSSS